MEAELAQIIGSSPGFPGSVLAVHADRFNSYGIETAIVVVLTSN